MGQYDASSGNDWSGCTACATSACAAGETLVTCDGTETNDASSCTPPTSAQCSDATAVVSTCNAAAACSKPSSLQAEGSNPQSPLCSPRESCASSTECSLRFGNLSPWCNTDTGNCTDVAASCINPTATFEPKTFPLLADDVCKTHYVDGDIKCCKSNTALKSLFRSYKRQFGQCGVCIQQLEQMECALACDPSQSRFFSNDTLGVHESHQVLDGPLVPKICPRMCKNLYQSCKDVWWNDKLQFLLEVDPQYSGYGDRYDEAFCVELLDKDVDDSCSLLAPIAGATMQPICSPKWFEAGGYCHGSTNARTLGFAAAAACMAFVCAVILYDFFHVFHLPFTVEADAFFATGIALGILSIYILPEFDINFQSLIEYRPSVFKFLMLPSIVFNASFHADSSNMFLEFNQNVAFGVCRRSSAPHTALTVA